MKVYIREDIVVVNNPFEKNVFIYDRKNRTEYKINEDTFDIIFDIKNNEYTFDGLIGIYPQKFVDQLFELGILTLDFQKSITNIKKLEHYNNARIYTELTDKCNLKCKHCYGSFDCSKSNSLKIEDLKKVIANASRNGVYQFDLTGGEPFLYAELKELLECLYNEGMLVKIFTNLTLLTDDIVELLEKYMVKAIVTSIDSSIEERHDEFRGQQRAFGKTIKALCKLQEIGFELSVNTMIGDHNSDELKELVQFINSLNVNSVLDVIVPEGRAKNLNVDIRKSALLIKKIYDENYNIIDKNAIAVNCGIGDRFIYIKSNGNIYTCPSLIIDEYKVGNISDFDTDKVWELMSQKFDKGICSKRTDKCGNCNGGCRARALKMNGYIDSKDDVYCVINDVECEIC